MGRLYRFLGMSTGVVVPQQPNDEKIAAYAADITYGTNNEFGFDYLRDNMEYRVEDRRQRRLFYAIVDEVDSILIDEARTPLIISGQAEDHTELYVRMNAVPPLLKRMASEPKPHEPEPKATTGSTRRANKSTCPRPATRAPRRSSRAWACCPRASRSTTRATSP